MKSVGENNNLFSAGSKNNNKHLCIDFFSQKFEKSKKHFHSIVNDAWIVFYFSNRKSPSESISHIGHRKEPLLILIDNGISTWVIGLRKDILIARNILQVKCYFQCAFGVLLAIGYAEVATEIRGLLFAKRFAFVVNSLSIHL